NMLTYLQNESFACEVVYNFDEAPGKIETSEYECIALTLDSRWCGPAGRSRFFIKIIQNHCSRLILHAMEQLLQQIEDHKKEIGAFTSTDDKQVEEFRIRWLGTKGIVKAIMGEMKNVPVEQKKEFGQLLNEFKQ